MNEHALESFIAVCNEMMVPVQESYGIEILKQRIADFIKWITMKVKEFYSKLVKKPMMDAAKFDKLVQTIGRIKQVIDKEVLPFRNNIHKFIKPKADQQKMFNIQSQGITSKLNSECDFLRELTQPSTGTPKYKLVEKSDVDYIHMMSQYYIRVLNDLEKVAELRGPQYLGSVISAIMNASVLTTSVYTKIQYVNKVGTQDLGRTFTVEMD